MNINLIAVWLCTKILNLINTQIFALFLGSFLTYLFSYRNVKANNKFIVLNQIKSDLINAMDKVHTKLNEFNMQLNFVLLAISQNKFEDTRLISDKMLFIYNDINGCKNKLIDNYELLKRIYRNNFEGKKALEEIISKLDIYLNYEYEQVYRKIDTAMFKGYEPISGDEYLDKYEALVKEVSYTDKRKLYKAVADSHLGAVVPFINKEIADLINKGTKYKEVSHDTSR